MSQIPLIDLSPFILDENDENKNKVIQEIKEALHNIGFFYVTNCGITDEDEKLYFDEAKRLFELPLDVKKAISTNRSDGCVGYVGIGIENLDGDAPLQIDYKEAMDLFFFPNNYYYKKSIFPPEELLPGWKENIFRLYNKFLKIGEILVKIFGIILKNDENLYWDWYKDNKHSCLCRLLRYPPMENKENLIGCGAHSDYGILTLLLQDNVGGLQVEHNGKWIDAVPVRNSLVVNVGDIMQMATNGLFKATKHRVINKSSEKERFVCLLFCEPSLDMPLPDSRPFKDHLHDRLSNTYVK